MYLSLHEQTKPTNRPDIAVKKMLGLNASPVEKDDITHTLHAIVIAQKKDNKGAKIKPSRKNLINLLPGL